MTSIIFHDHQHNYFNHKCQYSRVSGFFEFFTPSYIVRDPKLLKKLTVKDFDYFTDHKILINEDADPLFSKAIFLLKGQKWRGLSFGFNQLINY